MLKEPEGFVSDWEEVDPGGQPVEAVVLAVPWYENRYVLTTRASPDAVAVGANLEQGVVLLSLGGSPAGAGCRMIEVEETSGNVLALTPERALSIAVQIVKMARLAQSAREP